MSTGWQRRTRPKQTNPAWVLACPPAFVLLRRTGQKGPGLGDPGCWAVPIRRPAEPAPQGCSRHQNECGTRVHSQFQENKESARKNSKTKPGLARAWGTPPAVGNRCVPGPVGEPWCEHLPLQGGPRGGGLAWLPGKVPWPCSHPPPPAPGTTSRKRKAPVDSQGAGWYQ